jgi:hypothetical protein
MAEVFVLDVVVQFVILSLFSFSFDVMLVATTINVININKV